MQRDDGLMGRSSAKRCYQVNSATLQQVIQNRFTIMYALVNSINDGVADSNNNHY